MCPATGSSGSTSPRKRSRARASTRSSERVGRLAATAGASRFDARGRAMNVGARDGRCRSRDRPALARPRGKSAVEHRRRIVPERAQHPPQARRVHAAALVVRDDLFRGIDAEATEQLGAGLGAGQRMAPVACRSSARTGRGRGATNRAPGRWPRRYADSPHASGCARSCRTSTRTNAGSSRRAARSAVEMSVVNISRSSPWSGAQRGAMCASSSRRRNSWKCCIPSSIGDW